MPADAIEAAELAEAETAYRLQLARESFQADRRLGQQEGRAALEAEQARERIELARRVTGPTCDEPEVRHWGPGGPAHFAGPRPGDFPGRIPRWLPAARSRHVRTRQPEPLPAGQP